MSSSILHKRSLITGSIPTTNQLLIGEVGINVPDGKIYIQKSGSTGQSIESAITSNSTSSIGILTLSGSLILSGSPEINSGSVLDISTDNVEFEFDYLSFLGSAEITGSLDVTGTVSANAFTGSFAGDGSGLTNLNIDTGSFTTTSSFYQFTASYYIDSASIANQLNNITFDTSSLVTTSSFNQFTSSYGTGSFTGSFAGDGSITGSLFGTSSWAISSSQAISSSVALTASFLPVGTYNITASWAQSASNAISAQTASTVAQSTINDLQFFNLFIA